MFRALLVLALSSGLSLFGQASKKPWWSGKTMQQLNLSPDQVARMRATLKDYRPRLQDLRAGVQKAEQDLEDAFNADPVDTQKANEIIGRLVAARAALTRTISQMGLTLRTILTQQQWQDVEKLYSAKVEAGPPTTH